MLDSPIDVQNAETLPCPHFIRVANYYVFPGARARGPSNTYPEHIFANVITFAKTRANASLFLFARERPSFPNARARPISEKMQNIRFPALEIDMNSNNCAHP